MSKYLYLFIFTLTFASMVIWGCARPTDSPDPLANTANVRVLHFSPGAPAVNLQINGSRPRVAPGSTAPDTIRYLDNRPYYNVPAGPVVVSLTSARSLRFQIHRRFHLAPPFRQKAIKLDIPLP